MIFLILIFLISCFIILILGKNIKIASLVWIFTGLTLLIVGYMLYFAKIGGISSQLSFIFFISPKYKYWLQYIPIGSAPLNQIVNLGRCLALYGFISFGIYEADFLTKRRHTLCKILSFLPSLCIFTLFTPSIYIKVNRVFSEQAMQWLDFACRLLMLFSMIFILLLLAKKSAGIPIKWLKKRLICLYSSIIVLLILFIIIGILTPLQIYDLNRIYFLMSRIFFYDSNNVVLYWRLIITLSICFTLISVISLITYLKFECNQAKSDITLEKQAVISNMGIRVLSHGIKNTVLSNTLALQEMEAYLYEHPDEYLSELVSCLAGSHNLILARLNDLSDFFKQKKYLFHPVVLQDILCQLDKNYPEPIQRFLSFSWGSSAPVCVLADTNLLQQLIDNIIKNSLDAIKAKENGKVEIRLNTANRQAVLEIEDNGTGIPSDLLKKIFTPFYTSKNSKNNWGLGLAYANKITRLHKGEIRIESVENHGTTVFILIPLYQERSL